MAGKPKSNKIKKQAGNPGKRPLPEPIRGEVGVTEMPDYFTEREAYYWTFFTGQLNARGDLDKVDGPAVNDMSVCCARLDEAEALIREHGLLIKGERGLVKNPAVQLARNYRQQAMKYFEMVGVTSAPRSRMNIPEAEEDDDLAFQPPAVKDY